MFNYPETITYWTPASNDGAGGFTYVPGVKVAARVAYKSKVVIDDQGKQVTTKYAVYTEADIPEKAWVYVGDAEGDAEPPDEARVVLEKSAVPSFTTAKRVMI